MVKVIGENETAQRARAYLAEGDVYHTEHAPLFTFTVKEVKGATQSIVDGVDSPLEARFVTLLAELSPAGKVLLARKGGNQNDRALVVTVGADPKEQQAVALAILRTSLQLSGRKRRWFGRIFSVGVLIAALLLPQRSMAQITGGTVDQGQANPVVSNANAWGVKIVFGGAQIDPRAVTASKAVQSITGTIQSINGTIGLSGTPGVTSLLIRLRDASGSVSGGSVAFEISLDGALFFGWNIESISGATHASLGGNITVPTLGGSALYWAYLPGGWTDARFRVTVPISGAAITVNMTGANTAPFTINPTIATTTPGSADAGIVVRQAGGVAQSVTQGTAAGFGSPWPVGISVGGAQIDPRLIQQLAQRLDAAVSAAHTHTSAATLTLTAPGGQFVYITGIDISNCEGATIVTAAAPTYITTTGLVGSPQYQVGSGPATAPGAGVCSPMSTIAFATPLRSQTTGTSVTFVMPTFITNQTVSLNVYWYNGT